MTKVTDVPAEMFGARVERPEALYPALVDVAVNRRELSMPPAIFAKQALGFGLFMVRAVMNCHGNELIDLAKTNLFR